MGTLEGALSLPPIVKKDVLWSVHILRVCMDGRVIESLIDDWIENPRCMTVIKAVKSPRIEYQQVKYVGCLISVVGF